MNIARNLLVQSANYWNVKKQLDIVKENPIKNEKKILILEKKIKDIERNF